MDIGQREEYDKKILMECISDLLKTSRMKEEGKHLPLKNIKQKNGIDIGIIGYGKLAEKTISYLSQLNHLQIGEPINEIIVLTTDEKYSDLEKKEKEISAENKIKIRPVLYKNDSMSEYRDFSKIKELLKADMILVTAGNDPKNAISREECINANLPLIKEIGKNLMGYNGLVLVATNPVDIMTYALASSSKLPYDQVVGLTQTDTNRFKYYLSKYFNIPMENITAFVIGAHNDTMVPLLSYVKTNGISLLDIISNEKSLKDVRDMTMDVRDMTRDYGLFFKKEGKTPIDSPAKSLVDTIIAAVKGLGLEENEIVTTSRYHKEDGIFIGDVTLFKNKLPGYDLFGFIRVLFEKEYDLKLSKEELLKFKNSKEYVKRTIEDLIKQHHIEPNITEVTDQTIKEGYEKLIRELISENQGKQNLEIIELIGERKENEFPYNLDIILSFVNEALRINTKTRSLIPFKEIKGARSMNITPDKKKLVFGCKNTIRIYDADTFKEILEVSVMPKIEESCENKKEKLGLNSVELISLDQTHYVIYAARSNSGIFQFSIKDKNIFDGKEKRIAPNQEKILQKITENADHIGPLKFIQCNNKEKSENLGMLYAAVDYMILECALKKNLETILNYKYATNSSRVRNFKIKNNYLVSQDRADRIVVYNLESKRMTGNYYSDNIQNIEALSYGSGLLLALKSTEGIELLSFEEQNYFKKLGSFEHPECNLLLKLAKKGNSAIMLFALSNSILAAYLISKDYFRNPISKNRVSASYFNLPIEINNKLFTDAAIILREF